MLLGAALIGLSALCIRRRRLQLEGGAAGGGTRAKPRAGKNPKHKLPTSDMDMNEEYDMEDGEGGVGNGGGSGGGNGNGVVSSPGGKSDAGLQEEGMD